MILNLKSGTFELEKDFNFRDLPTSHPFETAVVNVLHQWLHSRRIAISTSGSTGEPQTIQLTENLLRWSAANTILAFGLQSERVLLCLSAEKIGGAMMAIRSSIYNWELTCIEPVADAMLELPADHKFTFISLVPYQLEQILNREESRKKLGRFKVVLIGGAAVSPKLEVDVRAFNDEFGTACYHTYAMTETASHVAFREISQTASTAFKPMEGVVISIGDDQCASIEIQACGLTVKTNDLIEFQGDGFIYLGRKDDVINSGGLKINLHHLQQEMESRFTAAGISARFFLHGKPDEKWGEKLVMVLSDLSVLADVQTLLLEHIDPKLQPKYYFKLDKFELTQSGKIDRIKSFALAKEIS